MITILEVTAPSPLQIKSKMKTLFSKGDELF
jgi:hypothetical protein